MEELYRRTELRHQRDGFIAALGFGGFLVIVGLVFVTTPNLWQKVLDFFANMSTRSFPFGGPSSTIALPAPLNPGAHEILYNAVLWFDVAFGALQLVILGMRFWMKSRLGKIAETLGNAVFWLGSAFLVNAFLLTGTLAGWFEYWSALIILVGISLVARAMVYFLKR
jgi:hypothetical protein